MIIQSINVQRTLLNAIEESQRWLDVQKEENTYSRDLAKRIELIYWVLENMKNHENNICAVIEKRINEIIDEINKKNSIIEVDPLDSEVRILDWILYVVSSNE